METIEIKSKLDMSEIKEKLQNNVGNPIDVITDWIYDNYLIKIIKNTINDNFVDFNEEEREGMVSRAIRKIEIEESLVLKNIIRNELKKYFQSTTILNIDGFVNFRLKSFKDKLFAIAEESAYEHIAINEYNELMNLLDYFDELSFDDDY